MKYNDLGEMFMVKHKAARALKDLNAIINGIKPTTTVRAKEDAWLAELNAIINSGKSEYHPAKMEKPKMAVEEFLAKALNKTQPATKTEYIKCDFKLAWEALKEFQEGGEFYSYVGDNTYLLQAKDTLPEHFCSEVDNLYKKVETPLKWYDNIGEKGVLCWVSDEEGSKQQMSIIAEYDNNYFNFPFTSNTTIHWRYATPLTKAELLEFVDSVEE